MYRIEVAPGEETVFRTIEELAVGIRNGVITQRSRIYHHATQKWLPIGLHPHYKKALEMPAASASPAPVTMSTPLPSPSRKAHGPSHAHSHPAARPPELKPVPEPKIHSEPKLKFEPNIAPEPKVRVEPKARHEPKPDHEPKVHHEPKAHPEPKAHHELKVPQAPKATHEAKATPEPKTAPEPKIFHERKATYEPAPVPKIRPPVQSPVVTMQQEVLRDLPVVSIPEPAPLPWQSPAPQAAPAPVHPPAPVRAAWAHGSPVHAPPVHPQPVHPSPAPPSPFQTSPMHASPMHASPMHGAPVHASPVHAPLVHASPVHAPPVHQRAENRSGAHAHRTQATISDVRPASYVPLEYSGPLEESHRSESVDQPARPTARRSRRLRGHPLRMLSAAAVLVVGTHLVLTTTTLRSAGSGDPPAVASADTSDDLTVPAIDGDQPASEAVTSAPARVPMSPGPAFAASAPARPGADSAARPAVRSPASTPAAPAEPAVIAPAPISLELGLPELPLDSIAPTARARDTMGMKKILRALNGPKPAETSPTP